MINIMLNEEKRRLLEVLNIPNYWDFSEDGKGIIVVVDGKQVSQFSMYEVLDSANPDFIMETLENIRKECVEHPIGKWREYYSRKCLEKFES